MKGLLRRWPSPAWMGLGSAVIILVLGWLAPLPLFQEGPPQGAGQEIAPLPLLPKAVVAGEIKADQPGLSKVKIKAATYARRNTCELKAELLQDGRVVAVKKMNCSWFPDLEWVEIPFYLAGSNLAPGTYQVCFSSPDSDPANAVAVMGISGQGVWARPVYCTAKVSLWSWLGKFRPDYYRLLAALVVFLALGGLACGAGAEIRERGASQN